MIKKISFLFLSVLMIGQAAAQKVGAISFPVNGYSVTQMGYPGKIIPGAKGEFIYSEYWVKNKERNQTNYYVQAYNLGMEEMWARPITKPDKRMEMLDLVRLNNSLAVVGYMTSSHKMGYSTYAQFFKLSGEETGAPVKLSNYDSKVRKGFEDEIILSPDKSHLMWMGHNTASATGKSRRYFLSVWDDAGTMKWGKELFIPHVEDKYYVSEAEVDNRGNAYFLLKYESWTFSEKDTLNQPWILRYDSKENKFSEHRLEVPGKSIPEVHMHLTEKGDLVVTGIISDPGSGAFKNGAGFNAGGAGQNWSSILFKKFNVTRELTLSQEETMEIPESWVSRYKERGANFSSSEFMEKNGKVFWILEEYYVAKHNNQDQFRYDDIAVIALDTETGEISWASVIEKKQRDYGNGMLLSYVPGISGNQLWFVYLTMRGAQGFIRATSLDANTGEIEHKDLVSNQNSDYLFFPDRSSMVDEHTMVLMGVGNPVGNDYRLIRITFE